MADDFSFGTLDTSPAVAAPVQYQPLDKSAPPKHNDPIKLPELTEAPPVDLAKGQAAIQHQLEQSAHIAEGAAGRIERLRQANDRTLDQIMGAETREIGNLSKEWNASAEIAKREPSLWDKFGSPAFVVAMLGSAFSAQPMNAALTAGGAAMQAMNEGNWADYKAHFDAWKENSKLALERGKMEHEMYSQILNKQSHDLNAFNSEMHAALSSTNDKAKLALLQAGMLPELNQAITAHNESVVSAEKARVAVLQNEIMRRSIVDSDEFKSGDMQGLRARMAEWQILSHAPKGTLTKVQVDQWVSRIEKNPQDFYNLSKHDQFSLANQIAQYHPEFSIPDKPGIDSRPPGVSEKNWDNMAMMAVLDPTYPKTLFSGMGSEASGYRAMLGVHAQEVARQMGLDPGDIVARRGEIKGEIASMGKLIAMENNVSNFSRVALRNLEVAARLADKIDKPGGSPVYQRWTRAGRQEIAGDVDVNNFNALIQPARKEIARIITNPSLTGGLTVYADKEGKEFLGGGVSGNQLHGLVQTFGDEFKRREEELHDEIERIKAKIANKPYQHPTHTDHVPGRDDRAGFKIERH